MVETVGPGLHHQFPVCRSTEPEAAVGAGIEMLLELAAQGAAVRELWRMALPRRRLRTLVGAVAGAGLLRERVVPASS
jgi:hypothetical protein